MSDLFLLRSKDRTSASSSSHNFRLDLQGSLIEPGSYNVEFINMQNSIYTIRSAVNDVIYFNENSTNKTATITAGYYTESTLPTAVKSTLDTASGGFATFTVTISASTKKMTIASTQNFSLKFATNTSPTYPSAAKTLGYANTDTSAATSQVGTSIVNLADPLSVSIRIRQASSKGFNCVNGAHGQILVPLDVGFGYLKAYKTDDFPQTLTFNNKANVLDIELRDLEGFYLDLNGSEFEMLLRRIN